MTAGVELTASNGNKNTFTFDHVFGPTASQVLTLSPCQAVLQVYSHMHAADSVSVFCRRMSLRRCLSSCKVL